ncbi:MULTISPECIES: XkdX family protein [Bacillus cereus group]|uniref:XkdX family protein n=1 Tax=Bacillus thuringiensis serovar andalousiensis TaxID=257985 RepID=A0A6H0THA0_BACTU|nr:MULTISPECIES: XkdX family protein [Bacillus cereus group]MDM5429058.1 XkdX family protein [Bacillus mycoides]QIW19064.1 XkdX family protein [Bacillus thuringiensis serovar andalousiensis]
MLTAEWWYESIKNYYELDIYKKEDVKKYYSPLKKINEEQYKEIIGEPTEEPKDVE